MAPLRVEDRGAVRILTLAEPERRNPLSRAMVAALLAALDEAEAEAGVRALVLTGEGKAFSAGADLAYLKRLTELPAEANLAHSEELRDLFLRLYTFPKPTVAAVNGPAVAGGAGLVLASDLAVFAEEAKIGFTEVKIGFVAALVAVLLVRHLGEKAARELLLTGEFVSAERARELGLANRVVPREGLFEAALELADRAAAGAPTSVRLTKALLAELPGMGLSEAFAHATLANAWARETENLKEGIAAFFERRPPRFAPQSGVDGNETEN